MSANCAPDISQAVKAAGGAQKASEAGKLQIPRPKSDRAARLRLSQRRGGGLQVQDTLQVVDGAVQPAPLSTEQAASTDMMASMMTSFSNLTSFKFTNDSDDEVHNAWGESDTEANFMERGQELQEARGLVIPAQAQPAGRLRLAKRKQRDKQKGKESPDEPVSKVGDNPQASSSQMGATSSEQGATATDMMTSMFNSFANININITGVVQEEEEEHNAWGDDGTDELLGERARELQEARGIVVPMLQAKPAGRERFAKRKNRGKGTDQDTLQVVDGAVQQAPVSTEQAASTDMMASMMTSFSNLTSFKFTNDSDDEVHNAWGESDTEANFMERGQELQEARGLVIPAQAQPAGRLRLAKRKQRDKQKGKESPDEPVSKVGDNPQASSSQMGATSSEQGATATDMMTSMFNSFANININITGVVQEEEEEHNAWGDDGTDELLGERARELQEARGIVVPMLQAKPAGRERFAKRKNRGKGPNLEVPTEPMSRDSGSAKSSSPCALAFAEDSQRERLARRKQKSQRGARSEAASPSLFAAAATSLVQFQQLFNLTQSRNSEDEDECFSIWGPDDTPAHYEERLLALEKARSEQAAARVPHHHAARAKRKPEVKAGTQVVPKVDDAKQDSLF